MSTSSFGIKLGRAIGSTAAYALESSVRVAQASGRFGADVVTGAELGYDERRAELLAKREAAAKQREISKTAAIAAVSASATAAPISAAGPMVLATSS